MISWFKSLFSSNSPRPVPGASSFRDKDGKVIYNLLDPWMQQFMGRCVSSVKKSGIKAKGTNQFSLLLGENQKTELILDSFWARFSESQNQDIFSEVVEAAKKKTNAG